MLSQVQKDGLQLIVRSIDIGNGWRQCSPQIFFVLSNEMPVDLVELDEGLQRVRLTPAGEAVAKWICKE